MAKLASLVELSTQRRTWKVCLGCHVLLGDIQETSETLYEMLYGRQKGPLVPYPSHVTPQKCHSTNRMPAATMCCLPVCSETSSEPSLASSGRGAPGSCTAFAHVLFQKTEEASWQCQNVPLTFSGGMQLQAWAALPVLQLVQATKQECKLNTAFLPPSKTSNSCLEDSH